MSSIEDRLREATRAAADTVPSHSQPPLHLPAHSPAFGWQGPRWRRELAGLPHQRVGAPRLMASVAAAVAMVAVAATALGVRSVVADHGSVGASGSASAAVPQFFAATVAVKTSAEHPPGSAMAVVGLTTTGKIVARVRPPAPYNTFSQVSAAADDRTFVLAAQKLRTPPASGFSSLSSPTRLYLLRLHPGERHPASLTALPIPALRHNNGWIGIALSPAGTRLAVEFESARYSGPSFLRVYDVANGHFRSWTLASHDRTAAPGINSPSWVGGDRFLAALVYTSKPRSCTLGCIQMLDTTRGGGSILTASKTIFRTPRTHKYAAWDSVTVAQDGSRVLLAGMAGRHLRKGVSEFSIPLLYDIAAPSGRILSHQRGPAGVNFIPLWAGPRGRLTIIGQPRRNGTITATIYSGRGRTPLRIPASTIQAAW